MCLVSWYFSDKGWVECLSDYCQEWLKMAWDTFISFRSSHPHNLLYLETLTLLDAGPNDVGRAPRALLHGCKISLHLSAWPQFLTEWLWGRPKSNDCCSFTPEWLSSVYFNHAHIDCASCDCSMSLWKVCTCNLISDIRLWGENERGRGKHYN